MHKPLRTHPTNPRWLEFRGKPLVLICATEHYGSVINSRFDFTRYLKEHAMRGHTLTRLFLLFREMQSVNNPCSPCKPESPDYLAPWMRTGPGQALDREPKYDLDRWNEAFFERLHRFMSAASDAGIVVEVTLFSNSYDNIVWGLNPLNPKCNIQELGPDTFHEYNTPLEGPLWDKQSEYATRIVNELNRYDNFYFEVCNEPGAIHEGTQPEKIDAWQEKVAALVRELEAGLPNQHMVFGSQAFTLPPFQHINDHSYEMGFDGVNVHPLPNICLDGKSYDLGDFMSKQLKLQGLKEFTLAAATRPVPICHDEDNIAACYRDTEAWTIHRKRAWTSVFCGAHYDMIDFTIAVHAEDGTPESRSELRSWFGYLSKFVHGLDLARVQPIGDWLLEKPEPLIESVLAIECEHYAIYLADPREREDLQAGQPIQGDVRFRLPEGRYAVSLFAPVTGQVSPEIYVEGGEIIMALPAFQHDIVLQIRRCVS